MKGSLWVGNSVGSMVVWKVGTEDGQQAVCSAGWRAGWWVVAEGIAWAGDLAGLSVGGMDGTGVV